MFRRRLIAPGPVEISPAVQLALAQAQLHHRSPEAKTVVKRARELLRVVAGVSEAVEPLILTASGTGAFEAVLGSLVARGEKVISISAGKFGERWAAMARALGYSVAEKRLEWGRAIAQADLLELLQQNPDAKALVITHSETSTGVLHDLEQLAKVAREQNPELFILVDAITSLGVAELRLENWGLDAVISGSQKATGAPPGLGFVFLSPRALRQLEASATSGYYFDLRRELKVQKSGETAFTPAINLIVGLNAALEPIAEEISVQGLEAWWANKKALNNALLACAKALGCSSYADVPSPACVTLVPPAPISGRELWQALLKRGARAQTGQDAIKDKICRISFMGHFDRYDALSFAGLLEEALQDCGLELTRGAGVAALWAALESRVM
ncbi:MAG: pyridoxal-phosphate-dependent aminotransferase family protein [Deinococcales bacterium]